MPYQLSLLNKDIRDKLVEAIRDNKVHQLDRTLINNYLIEEKRKKENGKGKITKNKNYLTIDGIKYVNESKCIDVEKNDEEVLKTSKGIFIDKIK